MWCCEVDVSAMIHLKAMCSLVLMISVAWLVLEELFISSQA